MKSKENPALPFANTVSDSLDLMKKMWGIAGLPVVPNAGQVASMAMRLPQQLPSMVAPTFDINELDRRIADLRAVEQWLELNASMLRTAIQTLEVQRATISTLKGISGAMLGPLTKPGQREEVASASRPPPLQPVQTPVPVRKSARKRQRPKAPPTPMVGDAPLNPTAWWNTLQDQFSKIAATAAAAGSSPSSKDAAKSANKARRKKPA